MIKVERTCRYGHGPLELSEGLWSLEEVKPTSASIHGTPGTAVIPTGRMFAAQLWVCKTCGYCELSDKVE